MTSVLGYDRKYISTRTLRDSAAPGVTCREKRRMTHEVARRACGISVQPVPKQDAEARKRNFDETYIGFDLNAARIEASRCIQCPSAPCQEACPVSIFRGHSHFSKKATSLGRPISFVKPATCLRCAAACARRRSSAALASLDSQFARMDEKNHRSRSASSRRFAPDQQRLELNGYPLPRYMPAPTDRAVVGSGPAGLAVAEQLALLGHGVTVYEFWPEPGGVLVYGIPNFKMRKTSWMSTSPISMRSA